MKVFEIVDRLERVVFFLKEENTGNANEFAEKIGVSRSMLFNYLEYLKAYEIEVKYDKKKNSFVLSDSLEIEVRVPIQVL